MNKNLIFLCCLLIISPVISPAKSSCPDTASLEKTILESIGKQQSTKEVLEQLIESNGKSHDFKAIFDFTFALKKKRNQELQILKNSKRRTALSKSSYLCAMKAKLTDNLTKEETLYEENKKLKIQILSLTGKNKMSFITNQKSFKKTRKIKAIKVEKTEALAERVEATNEIKAADKFIDNNQIGDREKRLIELRIQLEKIKKEMATKEVALAASWEKILSEYKEANISIDKLNTLAIDPKRNEIATHFKSISTIWRKLVDQSSDIVSQSSRFNLDIDLPEKPDDLIKQLERKTQVKEYNDSYFEATKQRDGFIKNAKQRSTDILNQHYTTLLKAGKLRAKVLNDGIAVGTVNSFEFTDDYFYDLFRELKITPDRWIAVFYSKFLTIRHDLDSGIKGYMRVFQALLSLLFFVIVLYGLFWFFRKTPDYLKTMRDRLVRDSRKNPLAASGALWLERIRPFIEWVLILVACSFAETLFKGTYLAEFTLFIPYFEIYAYYRIFRTFLAMFLSQVSIIANTRSSAELKERIHRTAVSLGRIFLISSWLLFTVQSTVNNGFTYILIKKALYIILTFVILRLVLEWKQEIAAAIDKQLDSKFGKFLSDQCLGKYAIFYCVPAAVIVAGLVLLNIVLNWSERFEIFRKIAAKIFKKRIETTGGAAEILSLENDSDYTLFFKDALEDTTLSQISAHSECLSSINNSLLAWSKDSTNDNTMAIVGEKGIGKTTLIESVVKDLDSKGLFSFYTKIPDKLTNREQVEKFFANHIQSIEAVSDETKKSVVFIDGAHNLFLAKIGGFNGYKTFIELMENSSLSIFWCLTFEQKAWNYLSCATDRTRYFAEVIKLKPWKETEIRELILERNKLSGLELSFDRILNAAKVDDDFEGLSYVENRFFTLLWEEAEGNPRVAMKLWPTCVEKMNSKSLRVGLPKPRKATILSNLQDDTLFVFTNLVKHENISFSELTDVSDLSNDVIRNALRLGTQKKILEQTSNGRYRVSPYWQHKVYDILERKHFIYGK